VTSPSRPRRDRGQLCGSPLLRDAYSLAAAAHGRERRATDERYFLDHVVEVASMLDQAGFDQELVAVGLLHDAVERGTLSEERLEEKMGPTVCALVLALSEDPTISSFDRRKAGLRAQVEGAGRRAVNVYAADKLSDIRGLRRGIAKHSAGLEQRMGTSVRSMAAHYRESVDMIASALPDARFLPALRIELGRLETETPQ
jgi:guanosine-3',5'-bis(diphosphate) 3'-pyrophosphohydrolase